MSDMKCPFCQQELREVYFNGVGVGYICPNPDCKKAEKLKGNAEFWQELIRTRKALDVAVGALKRLEKELYFNNAKQTGHIADSIMSIPSIALEQITAEQKDVK